MSEMEQGLPEGWVHSNIGEIVSYGSTNKATISDLSANTWVLELEDIEKNTSRLIQHRTLQDRVPKSAKNKFDAGDILYGKLRPYLNKVLIANTAGICSSEIIPLQINTDYLDPKYLFFWLKGPAFLRYVNTVSYGVNMPRLGTKDGKAAPFIVAPREEQTRIVEKLDQLLAQVDSIQARLNNLPAILKRFRQSVLSSAVSGWLTKVKNASENADEQTSPVTIGKPEATAPQGWQWTHLLELARLESGHTPRKSVPEYWDDGDVLWISLQDIRAAHGTEITDTKHKPTMLGIDNSSARLLPKGTVCFSRDISVGYTTIMGAEMATTQHFANWICGEELDNKYLMYALMAAQTPLTRSGQGTTVKTIYMPALKEFHLLTPPLAEQTEIVRRVEQYFALADNLENALKQARQRVDKLTQSILAKAFRGELVPQNPDDEPAEQLLARIAQARKDAEALEKSAKKAARSKKKA